MNAKGSHRITECMIAALWMAMAVSVIATDPIREIPNNQNSADSDGVIQISLPTSENIERADLYFRVPIDDSEDTAGKATRTVQNKVRGILMLVPGRNGNGRDLITRTDWHTFADKNHLILCGVSFASDRSLVERSYSNARSGSGKTVLGAIDSFVRGRDFGTAPEEELPIYLYGFSAGARFSASFVDLYAHRIGAWCAYAVGRWEPAFEAGTMPPGIVASGEYDAGCYHASLLYFQEGRKMNKPWVWLSLKEVGHQWSPKLDEFVRAYFHGILQVKNRDQFVREGHFRDIDTKKKLSDEEVCAWPIFATWLPKGKLAEHWLEIHHP